VRERQEEAKEEEEQLGSYCRKRKTRMQIADSSQQQQDHKICYKNYLNKTPGTKTQQNPKNSKQRERQRQRQREKRQTHTHTHTHTHNNEREERRRNEKKLQIWELKLPSSLSLCLCVRLPQSRKQGKKLFPSLFPWVSFVLFFVCFVDFWLVLLSSCEFCTWGGRGGST
jgi:cation transport ATPase